MTRWIVAFSFLGFAWAGCSLEAAELTDSKQDISATTYTSKAADCHVGDAGSNDFCSQDCPCDIGEGDCDSDSQCLDGLECIDNVGADFGYDSRADVCLCPDAENDGRSSFCSELCPCDEGEGDCDNDSECGFAADGTKLVCYHDVAANFGHPKASENPELDICGKPGDTRGVPSHNYCDHTTCGFGEGDCDTDGQCANGLECGKDNGLDFGFEEEVDVCILEDF